MFFWNKICVFAGFFFILASSAYAQNVSSKRFSLNYNSNLGKESAANASSSLVHFISPIVSPATPLAYKRALYSSVPENFYTNHFGFFCKQELAIEKVTKLPLRFRLGSLQQCNYYEGKK